MKPIGSFADSQSIFVTGGLAGHVYRVEFGAVRVFRLLANGCRQILGLYFVGEIGLAYRTRIGIDPLRKRSV